MKKKNIIIILSLLIIVLGLVFLYRWIFPDGVSAYMGVSKFIADLSSRASRKMVLSGTIVDDKGNPLSDVPVKIVKMKITDILKKEGSEKHELITLSSPFSLEYSGFHELEFVFQKDGYYPIKLNLTTLSNKEDSIRENLKIVLREIGELAQLRRGDIDVSWEKDEDGKILKRGWVYEERSNLKAGTNSESNNIVYDEPSEIDIYAEKTEDGDGLYLIANGDAGFTEPFDAIDFTYLPEAPETGYKNKIKLSFLPPKPDEEGNHMISKKMFLYFKLKEGLYGKASVEASESADKTFHRIVCPFYVNPKGARNLRSKEKF